MARPNAYDEIAEQISEILVGLFSDCHAPNANSEYSCTVTKDGLLTTGIKLARLRDWVSGMAETYKMYAAVGDEIGQPTINGINAEQIDKLRAMGINNLGNLAAAEPWGIASEVGVSLSVARRWVNEAINSL